MTEARVKELEAENERLRGFLKNALSELEGFIWNEYPTDHPTHVHHRNRDLSAWDEARLAFKAGPIAEGKP